MKIQWEQEGKKEGSGRTKYTSTLALFTVRWTDGPQSCKQTAVE